MGLESFLQMSGELIQSLVQFVGSTAVDAHEGAAHAAAEHSVALPTAEHANPMLGWIPILPLLGAILIVALFMRKKGGSDHGHAEHGHDDHGHGSAKVSPAGWVATLFALGSFAVTVSLFREMGTELKAIVFHGWNWFSIGEPSQPFSVDFAFRMDRLSGIMTLVVTGVGSLIHLYAIGYMSHDDSQPRFFCYLNMFLCAMLLLVLGDNLLVMFVGWEGVGLCSYLLIGFWYKEMPNAIAGQKAFVVNRIGDAGFLLGMFTLIAAAGTVSFTGIEGAVAGMHPGLIEAAAALLFVGAVGKSAQIPLFVWLPDAMAGPTPVSALIHAATMVTAGIYMITRLSFLYVHAPTTLAVICLIGACTAFLAATIALTQNDIKKVLAYSTVSQLGYMFMALGAGAFSNGIFHVVTHAFFKACLFMAAGSVIVGCHHEQDMRRFGGLWDKMVFTFVSYLAATLAIAGIPPLAGHYSKDAILWAVYSSNVSLGGMALGHLLWGMGILTAGLTAFYMTRSLVMTFAGSYRGKIDAHHHEPKESPATMVIPITVLAGLSVFAGWLLHEQLIEFLAFWTRPDMLPGHAHSDEFIFTERVASVAAFGGMLLAAVLYLSSPSAVGRIARAFSGLHKLFLNKWWIDELYDLLIVRPLNGVATLLFTVVDRSLIDALVNGTWMLVGVGGDVARRVHTGRIASYALLMFLSSIALIVFWLVL